MTRTPAPLLLAAAVAASLLLAACGTGSTSTSTPTATLGTDSAATKVGGVPDSLQTPAPVSGNMRQVGPAPYGSSTE